MISIESKYTYQIYTKYSHLPDSVSRDFDAPLLSLPFPSIHSIRTEHIIWMYSTAFHWPLRGCAIERVVKDFCGFVVDHRSFFFPSPGQCCYRSRFCCCYCYYPWVTHTQASVQYSWNVATDTEEWKTSCSARMSRQLTLLHHTHTHAGWLRLSFTQNGQSSFFRRIDCYIVSICWLYDM